MGNINLTYIADLTPADLQRLKVVVQYIGTPSLIQVPPTFDCGWASLPQSPTSRTEANAGADLRVFEAAVGEQPVNYLATWDEMMFDGSSHRNLSNYAAFCVPSTFSPPIKSLPLLDEVSAGTLGPVKPASGHFSIRLTTHVDNLPNMAI